MDIKKFISNIKHITNENKDIISLLLPSFIALYVFIICMVGSTFAWFTMSTSASISDIKTTTYKFEENSPTVTLNNTTVNPNTKTENDKKKIIYKYDLVKTELGNINTYNFSLTTTGTSKTGYIIIKIKDEDKTYNFKTVKTTALKNNKLSFTITTTKDITISLTPFWAIEKSYTPKIENNKDYKYENGELKETTIKKIKEDYTVKEEPVDPEPTTPTEQVTEEQQTTETKTEEPKEDNKSEVQNKETEEKNNIEQTPDPSEVNN